MKDLFVHIGYSLLALVILLLEMLLWTFFGLPYLLWKKLSYEAQCLLYPGGGWGHSMEQIGKNRQDRPDKQDKP